MEEAYLVKVDDVNFFTSNAVKQATFVVQVDNFQRLYFFRKLACCYICIDIEDLAIIALSKTAENGKSAGTDRCLNGTLVDLGDLPDKPVFVAIKIVSREYARCNGSRAATEFLEGSDELEILVEENAASNL